MRLRLTGRNSGEAGHSSLGQVDRANTTINRLLVGRVGYERLFVPQDTINTVEARRPGGDTDGLTGNDQAAEGDLVGVLSSGEGAGAIADGLGGAGYHHQTSKTIRQMAIHTTEPPDLWLVEVAVYFLLAPTQVLELPVSTIKETTTPRSEFHTVVTKPYSTYK